MIYSYDNLILCKIMTYVLEIYAICGALSRARYSLPHTLYIIFLPSKPVKSIIQLSTTKTLFVHIIIYLHWWVKSAYNLLYTFSKY